MASRPMAERLMGSARLVCAVAEPAPPDGHSREMLFPDCRQHAEEQGTLAAFLRDMSGWDEDCVTWNAARRLGRRAFVETRVLGVGLKLGLALAAFNALVGGSFADYDTHRLLLETAYYLAGSMVVAGASAKLEWRYLARRFRAVGADERDVRTSAPTRIH